jgi:hypothetical protein
MGASSPSRVLSSFMYLSALSRAIKFLYVPAPPAPTVWALKLPSWALVHKTTYAPMIYGNLEFFGPQMTFHRAQKLLIFRAQPPPTCPCNG